MIRVESFPARAALEDRANELEKEGFEMKHLAFRGQEPWAVFTKSGVVVQQTIAAPMPSPQALGMSKSGQVFVGSDGEALPAAAAVEESAPSLVPDPPPPAGPVQPPHPRQQRGKPNFKRR